MIPKRIFTTMVFDPDFNPFQQKHYDCFYHCFQSWHRLMPDYDIRIITLENLFDFGGEDDWIRDRLAQKDFIAVSHWARLQWLQIQGGFYVDLDIEAVRRFDALRDHIFFAGHEGGDAYCNNAIMGAQPGSIFVYKMQQYTRNFPLTHPEWPNETGPRMITRLLAQDYGWDKQDRNTLLNDGIVVYNSKAFYPYFWNTSFTPACIEPETFAVHHWASSWVK